MLDLDRTPDDLLAPTRAVAKAALAAAPQLSPNDLMIVGARCRDILHGALGHTFATTATLDLDLALALSSWDAYRSLASAFPKASDSGICYRINGLAVDLLPFGAVEETSGRASLNAEAHLSMRSLGAQRQRGISHVLAIEVTLADRVEDDDCIDAAVIYVGEHAYRRRDGIVTAPFALLGP